jgi:ribonuclease HII
MPRTGTRLARFDSNLRAGGFDVLVGTDEVGRGCLAGPVVAAAVILPPDAKLSGVRDSKTLTADARAKQVEAIRKVAWAATFCFVSARSIDRLNIRRASLLAMRRAIDRARVLLARRAAVTVAVGSPEADGAAPADGFAPAPALPTFLVVVDGRETIPDAPWPQRAVIDADASSLAVAAASIVAKTVRDGFMMRLALEDPRYGFERHKGYGTADHLEALERLGPSRYHRYSFFPVAQPKLFV